MPRTLIRIGDETLDECLKRNSYFLSPTGCRIWNRSLDKDGYGKYHDYVAGNKSPKAVHRIAWELAYGPIPNGIMCCHTCDTPSCIEVSHLFLGTAKDNNTDKKIKGRARGAHNGEDHPNSRLTTDEARAISIDERPTKVIAAEYGVSVNTVREIRARRLWRHLDASPPVVRRRRNKLSREQTIAIANDHRRNCFIAKEYGIDQSHVSKIKSGQRRK